MGAKFATILLFGRPGVQIGRKKGEPKKGVKNRAARNSGEPGELDLWSPKGTFQNGKWQPEDLQTPDQQPAGLQDLQTGNQQISFSP